MQPKPKKNVEELTTKKSTKLEQNKIFRARKPPTKATNVPKNKPSNCRQIALER